MLSKKTDQNKNLEVTRELMLNFSLKKWLNQCRIISRDYCRPITGLGFQ